MTIVKTLVDIAVILGFLYAVFIGQRSLSEWWKERKSSISRDKASPKEKLLGKVEAFWIKRVLEPSIQPTMLFKLDLKYKPRAAIGPWEGVIPSANPADITLLPLNKTIVDVFDDADGKLLILGEPGSGKTTTLLELARKLIDRVRQDSVTSIPVVFNLSSWAEARKPIKSWLIDELSDKYQIPREIGNEWIEKDELLLLLDGLDEVKQEFQKDCVNDINSFIQKPHDVKVVVCCRNIDYEAIGKRLRLNDAVTLQPLTSVQVDDYLSKTGDLLPDLQELFQKDPGWQEFAHSPLLLNIMVNVYKKMVDFMPEFNSMEARRRYLLKAYVDSMFERHSLDSRFTRQQTLDWLCWLARKMTQHGQDLFLIEKMQPDWLPPDQHRLYGIGIRLFVGLMAGSIFGLATGVSAGLIFGSDFGVISGITFGIAWGLIGWLTFERAYGWRGTLAVSLAAGVAFGVAGWLAFGVWAALIFGLTGGLAGSLAFGIGCKQVDNINSLGTPEKVVLVETLKWSGTKARRSLSLWIIFGLIVGLGIGIPVWLAAGPMAGWVYGIATTLVYVMTFGIAGGLTSREIETKAKPNQGIWRSRRNGSRFGGAFGIIMALIFGLSFGITFGPINGLVGSIAVGLAGWTVGWFFFGGLTFIQHYLLRIILSSINCMPWNYAKFLDYASDRIFLRKVGGGYIFIHRILLDHFAQMCE